MNFNVQKLMVEALYLYGIELTEKEALVLLRKPWWNPSKGQYNDFSVTKSVNGVTSKITLQTVGNKYFLFADGNKLPRK